MEWSIESKRPQDLFADLPEQKAAEQLDELLTRRRIRIERIVSTGQASAPGFWYDQPQAEWVLVLRGQARLRFEDQPESMLLKAGSYIDIAAHRRHRVEWTDPDQPTIWLAIHYSEA